jgi:hypothetical protein
MAIKVLKSSSSTPSAAQIFFGYLLCFTDYHGKHGSTNTSTAATEHCNTSHGSVTAVSAGVGTSLDAVTLALLALFLNERRRRKRIEN